jgi:hypothetical protein
MVCSAAWRIYFSEVAGQLPDVLLPWKLNVLKLLDYGEIAKHDTQEQKYTVVLPITLH